VNGGLALDPSVNPNRWELVVSATSVVLRDFHQTILLFR
jgi:hypothetical protein